MFPVFIPNQIYQQDPFAARVNVVESNLSELNARLNKIEELLRTQILPEHALLHRHSSANQMRLTTMEYRLGRLERQQEEILNRLKEMIQYVPPSHGK